MTAYVAMQGQLPSVPYDVDYVNTALDALIDAFDEQLQPANTKPVQLGLNKPTKPHELEQTLGTSVEDRMIVPRAFRIGWPQEALQVMQTVDELQHQLWMEARQRRAISPAVYKQRNLQHQEILRSLEMYG